MVENAYSQPPLLDSKQLSDFLGRVEFAESGCWLWRGEVTKFGYGHFWIKRRRWKVHRIIYRLCIGLIPDGKQLDHLCHRKDLCEGGDRCPHRRCCNPDHLEPVTARINKQRGICAMSRKTACPNGHPYDTIDHGTRRCRQCRLKWRKQSYRRNRGDLLAGKAEYYRLHREEISARRKMQRQARKETIGSAWAK